MTRIEVENALRDVRKAAEALGFALTWWSPEEIGQACPEELIDRAVQSGNDYLAECNPDSEDEE